MNVLVTGGAGYLGTTLAPVLLDRGHRVAVFDSLRFGPAPLLPLFRREGFTFARGDVRDRATLERFARDSHADAVVHLAAIVGYPACARWPDEARTTNVDGTANVAAVAGRDRPVLLASTSSCYGRVADEPCTEETPLHPLSLYGTSKAQAESIVLDRGGGGRGGIVYRIATAYGLSPRLRLDLLINDFVYRALHEHRLAVYEGHARRSFLHVADIARAIGLALENPGAMLGRVFNVGDEDQNYTKLDVCRLIQRHVPGVQIEDCPDGRDADRRDYAVSYARIRAAGFRAEVPIDRGLAELAAALRWIDRPEDLLNPGPTSMA